MIWYRSPKSLLVLLRVVMGLTTLGSCVGDVMCAQVTSTLNSNLEQTAGTTSTRKAPADISTMAHPDDFEKLTLDAGDTLEMSVFGAPEMSQTLQVDNHGDCLVPLAGSLHVAGDTTRQAAESIRQHLITKKMFNDPQVFLEIVGFTSHGVTVSGEVQSPGRISLLAPKPLIDVLALAGGETPAAGGEITIHHKNTDGMDGIQKISYSSKVSDSGTAASTLVFPGDTVNVRRAGVIYVLGAVTRPGGYLMVNGGSLSVPEAISLANGTTLVASTRTALVVSHSDGTVTRIEIPLDDEQRGKAAPTQLRDGDILYIITSKLKATLINTSNIISSAASAGIYAATAR